jgi:hypothetical protein
MAGNNERRVHDLERWYFAFDETARLDVAENRLGF